MELYIIAGPNGVGNTTFARTFLPRYADCKNFVNADLIAQGMSPFHLKPRQSAPADWCLVRLLFSLNGAFPLASRRRFRVEAT